MTGNIYIITNLINNMQYVGQTTRTIQQRFSGHKNTAKNNTDNTYLHRAMNKYGIENFKVDKIASINCDSIEELSEQLNYLEIMYIAEYNTLAPNGYNLTKGGQATSEFFKRKVDEYDLDGNYIQTYDSLIAVSRNLGITTSCAIYKCCSGKSKFAFQRIWRYHEDPLDKYELPEKTIAIRNYKLAPVDQYTKNGIFVQTFNSIAEANSYLKIDSVSSHISECCKGKLYSAYGYVWRYCGEPFNKYKEKDKRLVGCKKYDLNDNLLDTYSSMQDACFSIGKESKTATPNIVNCCKGNKKTAYGFKWKYC